MKESIREMLDHNLLPASRSHIWPLYYALQSTRYFRKDVDETFFLGWEVTARVGRDVTVIWIDEDFVKSCADSERHERYSIPNEELLRYLEAHLTHWDAK